MALGQRIRQLRMKKGMTQSQLAGEHITRNMLSQIENGAAVPSMKTLGYLARQLQVSVGYLLEGESAGCLSEAKKRLKDGDIPGAIALARSVEEQGDEGNLFLALAYGELARQQLIAGDFPAAMDAARQAMTHNDAGLYCSKDLKAKMLGILAHCSIGGEESDSAVQQYKQAYQSTGWEAGFHLLFARYYLSRGQTQAAEREIWTITALSDEERPLYLLMRGWLAVSQEKYANAISYLQQVEKRNVKSPFMRKDLYRLLETAYRELGDYKAAYEYAAKQREI